MGWRRGIAPVSVAFIVDGKAGASPPVHRSTETTVWRTVVHADSPEHRRVQEGRFGKSDHCPGRGAHADGIEQVDRGRTHARRSLTTTAISYATLCYYHHTLPSRIPLFRTLFCRAHLLNPWNLFMSSLCQWWIAWTTNYCTFLIYLHCGYWIISAENPVNPRIHWIFPLKKCPFNFSDSLRPESGSAGETGRTSSPGSNQPCKHLHVPARIPLRQVRGIRRTVEHTGIKRERGPTHLAVPYDPPTMHK